MENAKKSSEKKKDNMYRSKMLSIALLPATALAFFKWRIYFFQEIKRVNAPIKRGQVSFPASEGKL